MRCKGLYMNTRSAISVQLQYSVEEDPLTEKFRFSESDLRILDRFLEYIDEWHNQGIDHSKLSTRMTMNYVKDGQSYFESTLPDPTTFSAYAIALRPFIHQNEPTYFHKIKGILGRACESKQFRRLLKEIDNLYNSRNADLKISLRAGQDEYDQEKVFQIWLNSYVYHRDEDKRQLLESFNGGLPENARKAYFTMLFAEKGKAIGAFACIVRFVLDNDPDKILTIQSPSED